MELRAQERSASHPSREGTRTLWRCVGVDRLHAVSCGYIPFFTSDQLPHYARALLHVYGIPEVLLHIPGKRGPKPTPKLLPPSHLHYAQVVKRRKGGRVVQVTTKIVFGFTTIH